MSTGEKLAIATPVALVIVVALALFMRPRTRAHEQRQGHHDHERHGRGDRQLLAGAHCSTKLLGDCTVRCCSRKLTRTRYSPLRARRP